MKKAKQKPASEMTPHERFKESIQILCELLNLDPTKYRKGPKEKKE
jgi:hypothetical protein